jgi:hypothetical protein
MNLKFLSNPIVLLITFFTSFPSFAQQIIWEKAWGESSYDVIRDICLTIDGNYVVVGQTSDNGWVAKIDKNNGNILWSKLWKYFVVETV